MEPLNRWVKLCRSERRRTRRRYTKGKRWRERVCLKESEEWSETEGKTGRRRKWRKEERDRRKAKENEKESGENRRKQEK